MDVDFFQPLTYFRVQHGQGYQNDDNGDCFSHRSYLLKNQPPAGRTPAAYSHLMRAFVCQNLKCARPFLPRPPLAG